LKGKRELEVSKKSKRIPERLKKLLPLVAVFTIIISTTKLAYMGVDFNFLKYLNERNIASESLIGDIEIDDYIYNIDKKIANENGVLRVKQAIMDKDTIEWEDYTGSNKYNFILFRRWKNNSREKF